MRGTVLKNVETRLSSRQHAFGGILCNGWGVKKDPKKRSLLDPQRSGN
jgi:hypothetical protein